MKKLALASVSFLVLGSAGAFAAPCSSSFSGGFPPSASFFQAEGTGGALNGTVTGLSWPECTMGGVEYIPFSATGGHLVLGTISDSIGLPFSVTIKSPTAAFAPMSYNGTMSVSFPGFDVLGGVGLIAVTVSGLTLHQLDDMTVALEYGAAITPMPEPATLGLLGFGAACLGALRRRRSPA